MTQRQLASAACKVLSLIALYWALDYMPDVLQSFFTTGRLSPIYGRHCCYFLGDMLVFAFLWCGCDWLARRLAPESQEPVTSAGVDESRILGLAFFALGAILLLHTLPSLIHSLAIVLESKVSYKTIPATLPDRAYVFSDLFKALLGMLMLLGWRGLRNAAAIWRARTA
jgi:hypothetical protein